MMVGGGKKAEKTSRDEHLELTTKDGAKRTLLIGFDGTDHQVLKTDSNGVLEVNMSGVDGPATSTDNAIVRWDGTGGDTVQDSGVTISDTNNITLPALATVDGRDISVDGANIDLNTTHRGSDGSDHTFIDQSVVSGATPTFTGTNFTGIPTAGILDEAITLPKLAHIATQTFLGRTTAATGDVEALTIAQAKALLGINANYIMAYDTTTQAVSVADTYQDLTFNTNSILNGWTHTTGTNVFTCPVTQPFACILIYTCQKTAGGGADIGVRAQFNSGALVPSFTSTNLFITNAQQTNIQIFLFDGVATQILETDFFGDLTTNEITPGPAGPGASTEISASTIIFGI